MKCNEDWALHENISIRSNQFYINKTVHFDRLCKTFMCTCVHCFSSKYLFWKMHNVILFYSFLFDNVNNQNKWAKEYCVLESINKRTSHVYENS